MKPHLSIAAVVSFVISAAAVAPFAQSQGPRADTVDLAAIQQIKTERLERSQVMDTVWNLTDVHGPRLTNSPSIRAAAGWAGKRLTGWGVSNVRQALFDRVQAEDLMKNAVIVASFAHHAANRDALLPRKALPRPRQPASATQ